MKQAVKSLIVLSALCLVTIALAGSPPKPHPSSEFTLSMFAVTPNGYVSARTYYDQANQRYL